jgi:hypothetical protein
VSCGHSDESTETETQRRVLRIALVLNVTMFIVGLVAGLLGQSSSLIADALDMLADASAYAIALGAIGRSTRFKAGAATLSGSCSCCLAFWCSSITMARLGISDADISGLLGGGNCEPAIRGRRTSDLREIARASGWRCRPAAQSRRHRGRQYAGEYCRGR